MKWRWTSNNPCDSCGLCAAVLSIHIPKRTGENDGWFYTFNYTHIKYLDLYLLYSSGQLLIVKARTFIESQGQSPQSRPVLRVTGVAASQYVVPGLLVQEPQHGLVFHLRAAVTTVISSDRQKCQQSSIRILFSSVELFNWTFSIKTTWRITSPSGGFSRKVRRKLPAAL